MKNATVSNRASLFFLVFGLFFSGSACNFSGNNVVRGDGDPVTQTYHISFFDNIEFTGAYNVVLTEGNEALVTIETDSNLHELLDVYVEQETLHISTKREQALRPTKMDVVIVYQELDRIEVSGACKITSNETLVAENMAFDLSGASDVELTLEVSSLSTQVAGAGNISFQGTANEHRIDLAGASNLAAQNLITQSTHISLSGAGSATVYASDQLNATLSGVGKISYYGNPADKHISKSGLGSIRSAN